MTPAEYEKYVERIFALESAEQAAELARELEKLPPAGEVGDSGREALLEQLAMHANGLGFELPEPKAE